MQKYKMDGSDSGILSPENVYREMLDGFVYDFQSIDIYVGQMLGIVCNPKINLAEIMETGSREFRDLSYRALDKCNLDCLAAALDGYKPILHPVYIKRARGLLHNMLNSVANLIVTELIIFDGNKTLFGQCLQGKLDMGYIPTKWSGRYDGKSCVSIKMGSLA